MKKIVMLVGLATLLASPAFAQADMSTLGTGKLLPFLQGQAGAPGAGVPSGAAGAYAYEPSTAQECARRFKSYDPASGTYLGRDGYRYACP